MKLSTCLTGAALLAALSTASLRAEVKLPAMISSHMVLQRDRPIHLWGWADPGENIAASFHNASATTVADKFGAWHVYLPPQQAGGPYQLKVNAITLDDVLVGDVWFASGQSNMEMPLSGFPGSAVVAHADEEIAAANIPNIRLLLVRKKASDYPQRDYDTPGWTACTPETAAKFSAAAYFFGRDIESHEHVPIGLIDSTWGGTPVEAWISMFGISSDPGLMPLFASWAKFSEAQNDVPRMLTAEKRADADAAKAGQPKPKHPWHPDASSWGPAELFNGMIAPAVNFRIKGVIWYQGETNSSLERAPLYEREFPALIADWRKQWREGNFPFLYVQISSFTSTPSEVWPIVREAQRRTLSTANTGMAVTIDIGDPDNVHPADKQDVGARLALAARAVAYGENVEYSGPLYRETSADADAVHVWFDHVAGGLVAKGGALQGFEIAGDDHQFKPAQAHIQGESVAVSSPDVHNPVYVRYGWANSPQVNLFNSAGLPASPFTSEKTLLRQQ